MDLSQNLESLCVCYYKGCEINQKILPQSSIVKHKNHVEQIVLYNEFPNKVQHVYEQIQSHVITNPRINILEQDLENRIKGFKIGIDSLVNELSSTIHRNLDQLKYFDEQKNSFFESNCRIQNLNYNESDITVIQEFLDDKLLNIRLQLWETAWTEIIDLNNKAFLTLQEILAKLSQSVRILGAGQYTMLKSQIRQIIPTMSYIEALDLKQYGFQETVISTYNPEKTEGILAFYNNQFVKTHEIKGVYHNLSFIKGRGDLILFDYLKKEFASYSQDQNVWSKEKTLYRIPNFKNFNSVNPIDEFNQIVFTYTCDKGYDYTKFIDLINGIDKKIDHLKSKKICLHYKCSFRIDDLNDSIYVSSSNSYSLDTFQLYPFKLHQEKVQQIKFINSNYIITYDLKGLFKIWVIDSFLWFLIQKKEVQPVAKFAIIDSPIEVILIETNVLITTSKYIHILKFDELENKLFSLGKCKCNQINSLSAMKQENGIRIIFSNQNETQVIDFSL